MITKLFVLLICVLGVILLAFKLNAIANRQIIGGGATVLDRGCFAFPRFDIKFSTLQVIGKSSSRFSVSNLPSCRLMFGLRVQSQKVLFDFEKPNVDVSITISDALRGTITYQRSANLRDWHLSQSEAESYFWLDDYSLNFTPNRTYTIAIDISNPEQNENTDILLLQPFLAGGGTEL